MTQSKLASAIGLAICLLAASELRAQPRDSSPERSREHTQLRAFDVAAGELAPALDAYIRQSGDQLLYRADDVRGLKTRGITGSYTSQQALATLLQDTPLEAERDASGAVALTRAPQASSAASGVPEPPPGKDAEAADSSSVAASGPQDTTDAAVAEAGDAAQEGETSPGTGGRGRATTLDTIVVTAQKKVENIQKVPIAISAFGGEDLNDRKIETGGDLVTAVPNVTFSKTNFASYNFQIRGIGTQALSVTTDPAVAISFNSTPMIRNRLFEQEYFDVQRVEVLRGPQGTLYGRNATAGVVNMLPNIADPGAFAADTKAEIGNYETTRVNAMVNVPLSDTFAFRLATQYTKRDGYDHNTVSGNDVNDRDILGVRTSFAWKPSERFDASVIWDHFQEDDNRARTGKQLCHNDPGPSTIGAVTVSAVDRNYMSQGCANGSLYDRDAFGVPNGASIPFVLGAQSTGVGVLLDQDGNFVDVATLIPRGLDPFAGVKQSRNLREIATTYDPKFEASNDILQLNLGADVGDDLRLVSQTLYTRDRYYSTQDYGRFQSNPIFTNTSTGVSRFGPNGPEPAYDSLPNGIYCDPQLGCSDRLLLVDLVDAESRQWSQEFRLQSSYDGAFNFNVGANYLQYDVDESYYVFGNVISALADLFFNGNGVGNAPSRCPESAMRPDPNQGIDVPCVYVDPNSLRGINGQGHNYFRSRNVAQTRSSAIFGEGYWTLTDTLKLTAGLRWTHDVKTTTPYPSQTLLADSSQGGAQSFFGGYVGYGYPARPEIRQSWSEPTGRLVLDWSPNLSFTDSTLLYASVSRGYKAGGTNSPGVDANPAALDFRTRDPNFRAEYVNAFEVGTKNVMGDGTFVLNATAFYNDYKDYQISQIQDRATFNENFDAKTWGAEFEAVWKPSAAFQLSGNIGLLRTRVGANQSSIDVMDRTAGNPDWIVVKPWLQLASNCIAPKAYVEAVLAQTYQNDPPFNNATNILNSFCSSNLPLNGRGFAPGGPYDGAYGFTYDPAVDGPNGGQGFAKDVGGNELPNAPHLTVSLSPQYSFALPDSDLTLRADLYYQGESWARIYQDRIDRLHDWGNVNLSLTWYRPAADLTMQLYVKNALGGEAITGTFLNSDDTGLTSNIFIQDPRIVGFSVRKGFF